jgi:amidase
MTTFITRLENIDGEPDGLRLAVKDAIDVEGVPTTVGCRAVAEEALPADSDAACLAGARQAGALIVGKANLHELCFGASGVNPWFGTPVNPLDGSLVPGGSSSGCAVAVATGEADVAFGTDTAGSIRNPSACCGIAGLKTTWGRIALDGIWPLAPSMDTVGPMGRDIAGVAAGMGLLEPGFAVEAEPATTVGHIRVPDAHPLIEAAIEHALELSELEVIGVELPGWTEATRAAVTLLYAEALEANRKLVAAHAERFGRDVQGRFELASNLAVDVVAEARALRAPWRAELAEVFRRVQVLALPTLVQFPPRIDDPENVQPNRAAVAVSLAGHPALAQPVPTTAELPASLQLVGPDGSEDLLLATGAQVEVAVRS